MWLRTSGQDCGTVGFHPEEWYEVFQQKLLRNYYFVWGGCCRNVYPCIKSPIWCPFFLNKRGPCKKYWYSISIWQCIIRVGFSWCPTLESSSNFFKPAVPCMRWWWLKPAVFQAAAGWDPSWPVECPRHGQMLCVSLCWGQKLINKNQPDPGSSTWRVDWPPVHVIT